MRGAMPFVPHFVELPFPIGVRTRSIIAVDKNRGWWGLHRTHHTQLDIISARVAWWMLYTVCLKMVVTPNTCGHETNVVGYVGEYRHAKPIDPK